VIAVEKIFFLERL